MVDVRRIEELRNELGEADLLAVLDIFRGEAEQAIAGITGDQTDVDYAKMIHFLRSGALNLGLQSFADQAAEAANVPAGNRGSVAGDLGRTLAHSARLVGLDRAPP